MPNNLSMRNCLAFIFLFIVLISCNQSKDSTHGGNGSATNDNPNQALYDEVMRVHDEVMPKMEDLYKLKTKIYTTAECKQAYLDKFGKSGTYDFNASGVVLRDGLLEKVYQRVLIKHRKKS
jgi:hypothetical protein